MLESLVNKVAVLRPGTLLKRGSNIVALKNIYFEEHLRAAASISNAAISI